MTKLTIKDIVERIGVRRKTVELDEECIALKAGKSKRFKVTLDEYNAMKKRLSYYKQETGGVLEYSTRFFGGEAIITRKK